MEISPKTPVTVNLRLVVSIFITMAVAVSTGTEIVLNKLNTIEAGIQRAEWKAEQARLDCVTEVQARQWLDNQRRANKLSNGSVEWTELPNK